MNSESEVDRKVEIYRQDAEAFGSVIGWMTVLITIVVLTLVTLMSNFWDMNVDGELTISDVWSAFVYVLTIPGNLLLLVVPDGLWNFFELDPTPPPTWMSLLLSATMYSLIAGMITGSVAWLLMSSYRLRVSWQLKPRLRDHLLPSDAWMLGFIGLVAAGCLASWLFM